MKIKRPIIINYDDNIRTNSGEYVYFNDKLYICEIDEFYMGCKYCDFVDHDGSCMIVNCQCDCGKYSCMNLIFKLVKDEFTKD